MNAVNRKKIRDQKANEEKDRLLDPEKLQKRRKKKIIRGFAAAGISLAAVVMLLFASFEVVKAIGKSNLQSRAAALPQMQTAEEEKTITQTEKETWKEGSVKYNGRVYAYNQDILTFLFLGIDKKNEVKEVEEGTDGGQADALFLLVLNPHDKSIRVIGINRNTMTDIDMYNEYGAYVDTVTAQIAVQHGFGNGLEESCGYQVNAVKKLFYNLPVHGYCAVNMDAVIDITDLVGGIEVEALEDVKSALPKTAGTYVARSGETCFLDGEKAFSYVKYRDIRLPGSADMRLKRQQQFLTEFIKKTKAATRKDLTLPVQLYNAVTAKIVTDVTADEVAYLASIASGYRFDSEYFYSLKGETVQGEKFEEFYADDKALYEMILEIFYEPAE